MTERIGYICENPACSLGAVGEPGRFTGGITAEHVHILKGTPVDQVKDYGDGYCPNCGAKGRKEG